MITELREDFLEIIDMLRNDHIRFPKLKKYIRALSPLWFVIRITQFALAIGSFYFMYIALWMIMG